FRIGLLSVTIAIVTSALAGLQPALSAAMLPPARAMRSELAGSSRRHPPRLVSHALRGASFVLKLPISGLFRQRTRTLFTAFGAAAGVLLIITSIAMLDAMEYSMRYYFDRVRNYDVDVAFEHPVSDTVLGRVRKWPGVVWAEQATGIPAHLAHRGRVRDTVVSAVPTGSRLQRFRDLRGRHVSISGEGLYLNQTAARNLRAEIGDLIRVDYSYNSRDIRISHPVRVARIIEQPIGATLYMSAEAISRYFGRRLGIPEGTVSALVIKARPGYEQAVARRAFDLPDAVSVETTSDIARQMDKSFEMMYTFIGIMMLFAGMLTTAIVYNTLSANVFERRAEIASLRALGITHDEIRRMLNVENFLCALLGVIIGVPAGIAATRGIIAMFESDLITYQFYIAPRTYVVAVVFTILLVMLSQLPAMRALRDMNLAQMTRLHGE
ncbi:MAG: ABC transporter permease, partial [Armatimonadetes bacterium]|nr:ABC transporter permease [Armatimonadota bacterium]